MRSVARLPRLMAAAIRLAAAARNAGNRTAAKISQFSNPLHYLSSLTFQLRNGFSHGPPYPSVFIR